MSETTPTTPDLYRSPGLHAEVLQLIDLAERQVERLDAVAWQFAIKLAAGTFVADQGTWSLLRVIDTANRGVLGWVRGAVFFLALAGLFWGLNRERVERARVEARVLRRAVLAAHELLPLAVRAMPPAEEQALRMRLMRLPMDMGTDEARPRSARSSPAAAADAPA